MGVLCVCTRRELRGCMVYGCNVCVCTRRELRGCMGVMYELRGIMCVLGGKMEGVYMGMMY